MMNSELASLFRKYTNSQLSRSEMLRLQDLLAKNAELPELRSLIGKELEDNHQMHSEAIIDNVWLDHLEQKVGEKIFSSNNKKRKIFYLPIVWRSVAAIFFAFLLAAVLYYVQIGKLSGDKMANTPDEVAPGKSIATLLLADGTKINLNEQKREIVMTGKWTYGDGTMVTNDRKNEIASQSLTLSVPKGGTYRLTLPDGTKVWLNSDTKLTYPSRFEPGDRVVLLEGEAYFEVATKFTHSINSKTARKKIPFVVNTKMQSLQVLGTHFNLAAYADESDVKTTLVEGSVRVTSGPTSSLILPGQQAVVKNGNITLHKVDTELYTAWKDDLFSFSNETLEEILREASRWYNVKIFYDDDQLKKERFEGLVSRESNLSALLNALEKTGDVRFDVKNKQVIVFRK